MENGAVTLKYGDRAEYQISRNELPCAKSPIVRDLIGDCRELSVLKLHVFDTRAARNVIRRTSMSGVRTDTFPSQKANDVRKGEAG